MDPYKTLGVTPDATDEQIKTAYRNLARKYHPDNYANNPLADLAQEKMKQINEAYDVIQRDRRENMKGPGGSGKYGYQGAYQSTQTDNPLHDIRILIMQRRIDDAEELLDAVPAKRRDAEWYFLKGNVYYNRGWLDQAYQYYSKACQLSPANNEYKMAMQQMMWQRNTANPYQTRGYTATTGSGCDCCDMFTTLVCADCCCECMGGDLVSCC